MTRRGLFSLEPPDEEWPPDVDDDAEFEPEPDDDEEEAL